MHAQQTTQAIVVSSHRHAQAPHFFARSIAWTALLATLFALTPLADADEEAAAAIQMPPGRPVEVQVSVDLVEVSQIVDHDQKFELEFNVFYTWRDPRFAFDPNREGVMSKLIAAEDVWNPEPELCDELDVDVRGGKAVRVSPDGTMTFSRYYRGTVGGSLDLHEFPLDRHTLEVDLEEAVFEADQVVFVPAGAQAVVPDRAVPHGWKLNGISSEVRVSSNQRTGERYSMLRLNLDVERDPHFYFWAIVVPLIPIVATAWTVFWMHSKEFSSQVTVGITAMLTIVAYRISVDSSLPPLNYMTRMDYFLCACQVFVFGAFLVVIAIHVLSVRGTAECTAMAHKLNMNCRWLPPFLLAASSVLLIVLPAHYGHWTLLGTAALLVAFNPPTPSSLRIWWVALTHPLEDLPAEAGETSEEAEPGPAAVHQQTAQSSPAPRSVPSGVTIHRGEAGSAAVPRPTAIEPRRRTVL